MGFLDLLKPKSRTIQQVVQTPVIRPEADITKTYIVDQLFKIPKTERNNQWYLNFYDNVPTASFACDSPQILTGPDGFPYFILRTPEVGKPFESFCIRNMNEDFLLDKGWGVVFNPKEDNTADWVFTHGDLVNLKLNNEFYTVIDDSQKQNIEFKKTVGVTTKEEQVMLAQPSEEYLPKGTRAALRRFLKSKGIKNPMVMMLTSTSNGKVVRKLAFNIHPENYPVASQLDYLMQQVGWFLPNSYYIIPLPKNSNLRKGFNDL
jgi:hypothetical protein